MNSAQVTEILKKNSLSIACGVVAIVAVVAAYWPVGGKFAELKTESDQHAGLFSQLTGLRDKERKLPLTDPAQTTQDPLSIFPNEKTIELGTKVTGEVSDQSKKMVDFVVNLNRREHVQTPRTDDGNATTTLLVPEALPTPTSDTPKFRFGDLYKLVLNTNADQPVSMTTDPKLRDAKAPNLANDILHAGVPPTEAQITDAKAKLWNETFSPRIILVNGQPVNQQQITQDYQNAAIKLPDDMKLEVAQQKKVYLAPDALVQNPNVIANNVPATVDIWYAQVALWIQQDVCNAIAQANAKSTNILNAPIKHLIKLNIPQPPGMYTLQLVAAAGAAPGTAPPAAPVEGGDTQTLPKTTNDANGITGRVSNPFYDVIRFQLVLNVEASQVPYVISALSANRLLSVYNMDVVAVDSTERAAAGFIYGANPVVQLNLKCETLFMRKWTAPLMPDNVKTALGIATAAPAPAPAPGATPQ
jgi:hypothetical protein